MTSLLKLLPVLSLSTALPLSACELSVGWEEWKPYIYSEEGQLKGTDYDYMMRLSDAIDCKLNFVEIPWIQALEQMEQGKLDLLPGASRMESLKAFANFSAPYHQVDTVLVTNSLQQPDNIHDWLQTHRIGLIQGFQYPGALMDTLDEISPLLKVGADNDDELLQMLINRSQIDGYLSERVVAEHQRWKTSLPLTITSIPSAKLDPMYLMLSNKIATDVLDDMNVAIEVLSYHDDE